MQFAEIRFWIHPFHYSFTSSDHPTIFFLLSQVGTGKWYRIYHWKNKTFNIIIIIIINIFIIVIIIIIILY